MAGEGDKTERATPQKLRQARAAGQVPRSRDWTTALGLCLSLQLVVWQMPGWLQDFHRMFLDAFPPLGEDGALDNSLSHLFSDAMLLTARMVLPLLVIPLVVCAGSLIPGGLVFSPDLLLPDPARLNPLQFFQRLTDPRSLTTVCVGMLKSAVLMVLLVFLVRGSLDSFLQLQDQALPDAIRHGTRLLLDGVLALSGVFIAAAVIDLPVTQLLFARSQRMSKQEVKDEYRQNEGRPEVRQKIRQIQIRLSRRAVRKAVPAADVVVVNPEHYAVALKYDEKRAQAPFVVAKGLDEMALYIRRVAAEHSVEVLELPPLARAIYNTSQINQQIPAALYEAVARVLTYVFQIRAFRDGRRKTRPNLAWSDLVVPPNLSNPT